MKPTRIILLLFFLISTNAFAGVDSTCWNSCLRKNYSAQYCRSVCAVNNSFGWGGSNIFDNSNLHDPADYQRKLIENDNAKLQNEQLELQNERLRLQLEEMKRSRGN